LRFVLRTDKELYGQLTARQLRYLDHSLEAPWSVSLSASPGLTPAHRNLAVQVPHPGLFIVQEVLIRSERDPEGKRPKDMGYLYQVLVLFREIIPQLA
jgi:hypothetical protein